MTTTPDAEGIRVTDVDQVFPTMVERAASRDPASGSSDVAPQVNAALRDVLGWRPRLEDPKAFVNALSASFRLEVREGHVEAHYVPRGYAVQADLGAVTGGQASLYRRATVVRQEMLRIVDGLVPLRTEADAEDMEAYRSMVRGAVQRLVDELGAAGGPRVEMVDSYLEGLTGVNISSTADFTPDSIAGQLGALRDRFGLVDANVNTIEEEGVRTSFWTLADMVVDLRRTWSIQRTLFTAAGSGFIGTDLIKISRLMEAAADQVDEVEMALDSVLISAAERRTIYVDATTGLTLDGLLSWIRSFLTDEGRTIAEESGRDGIVSALTPTAIQLAIQFENWMTVVKGASPDPGDKCCHLLPVSCASTFPPGVASARSRVAMAGLCRLLTLLAEQLAGIGRFGPTIPIDISITRIGERNDIVHVRLRAFNVQARSLLGFVPQSVSVPDDGRLDPTSADALVKPLDGSSTFDSQSISGLYRLNDVLAVLPIAVGKRLQAAGGLGGVTFPAQDVPFALIDGERGRIINAPVPSHWPTLEPVTRGEAGVAGTDSYDGIGDDAVVWSVPESPIIQPPSAIGGPAPGAGQGPATTHPSTGLPDWLEALIKAIKQLFLTHTALLNAQVAVSKLTDDISDLRAKRADPSLTAARKKSLDTDIKAKNQKLSDAQTKLTTAEAAHKTAEQEAEDAHDAVPSNAAAVLAAQPTALALYQSAITMSGK